MLGPAHRVASVQDATRKTEFAVLKFHSVKSNRLMFMPPCCPSPGVMTPLRIRLATWSAAFATDGKVANSISAIFLLFLIREGESFRCLEICHRPSSVGVS